VAKAFYSGAACVFFLSVGFTSPAMGKMSDTRLTIGVQVVEPCTISVGRGSPTSAEDRSSIACASDRMANFTTVHGFGSEPGLATISARSETNPKSPVDSRYDIAQIDF
jgi:hypothetical protein